MPQPSGGRARIPKNSNTNRGRDCALGRKTGCALTVLDRFLQLLGFWLLHEVAQIVVGGGNFSAQQLCECENGVAPSSPCHGLKQAACIECSAGYVFVTSEGGNESFSDNAADEVVGRCRPNECVCINGTPLRGRGCQAPGSQKCSRCQPGFELRYDMMCKPLTSTAYATESTRFDSQRTFAGSMRQAMATHTEHALKSRTVGLDREVQAFERVVNHNIRKVGELQNFMRKGSWSAHTEHALKSRTVGLDRKVQAFELAVNHNIRKVGEFQNFMRKGSWSAVNSAGSASGTSVVRKEINEMECPETLARAFDENRGRLELHKVGISDSTLAECAGICSGKTLGVKVLDIAPGGLTKECLKRFLRGFANSNALAILRVSQVQADWALCSELSGLVQSLQAVTIGNGSFAHDDIEAEFLKSLVANPSLKSFSASDHELGKSSADALVEVLVSSPNLENLALVNILWFESYPVFAKLSGKLKKPETSANRITSSVVSSVRALPHLKSLNISGNDLDEKGIVELLTPLASLESLDISRNLFMSDHQRLGNILSMLPRLSKLSLGVNGLLELDLVEMFPPSSPLRTLQVLDLSGNYLKGIADFGATLLKAMPVIEELKISSNFLRGPNIVEFINGLPSVSKFRILELSGNCISRGAAEITAAGERLPSFRVYGLARQRETHATDC